MRNPLSYIGLSVLTVGGLGYLLACSEPTTPSSRQPSFATTTTYLTISGPNEIISPTRTAYNYTAYMALPYPNFYPWGVRTCPTMSLTSCTVSWSTRYGSQYLDEYHNRITEYLARDCTGGGTRSFQVRAQASAFGHPTETAYKVTALCGGV